ncbi:AI-2E family transporter [Mucilaginibacter sp. AK015]|uniref:AI-2E family transporter n=1 Tax=Mucilaginibacter sp. AK015 TaxID=2723072 RepID=UPI0016176482|nr:AI-2E family transporter [Mucilaginibacter sp. AK015]MBB5397223.1 putative PurR-regulated permease PerM [Mucilaginibacter sp. AK015]
MNTYTIFAKKILIVICLIGLVLLFGFASQLFLLGFAALLLAVLLIGLADKLSRFSGWSYPLALTTVFLTLLVLIAGIAFLLAPSLSKQAEELQTAVPESLDKLKAQLENTSWGHELMKKLDDPDKLVRQNKEDIISKSTGFFSATLGTLANFFIVIVMAVFLAAQPKLYVEGFLRLFPKDRAGRVKGLIDECFRTLCAWLKGKFLSMLVVGVLTCAGLLVLGVRIPVVLTLIAMALTFVPNLGPALAMLPAVLIALLSGPQQAVLVMALYITVQVLESYLITPMINQKAVSLPPALTLFWQVILGYFLGGLGLLLATPLLAVLMVLLDKMYIEGLHKAKA